MTIFDYIVLGIVFVSVLLSITRGVVREVVSLLGWIIAFFVASHYAVNFEPLLPQAIEDESLRMLIVFVMTFFVALVVVMVGSMLLSKLVSVQVAGRYGSTGACTRQCLHASNGVPRSTSTTRPWW